MIKGTYKIKNIIGHGGQGDVMLVKDICSKKKYVAKQFNQKQDYEKELMILKKLKMSGEEGFTQLVDQVVEKKESGEETYILVLEKLGLSLQDLIDIFSKFSLASSCLIGIKMTSLIQKLHQIGILHGDIKLDNILIADQELGSQTSKNLYLIDFGISELIKTKKDIKEQESEVKLFKGNILFTSYNQFNFKALSPRDDMISLLYLVSYCATKKLPWSNIYSVSREMQFYQVQRSKLKSTPYEICSGLAKNFVHILEYLYQLKIDEIPNYDWIKMQFLLILEQEGHDLKSSNFDWSQKTKKLLQNTQNSQYLQLKAISQLQDYEQSCSQSPPKIMPSSQSQKKKLKSSSSRKCKKVKSKVQVVVQQNNEQNQEINNEIEPNNNSNKNSNLVPIEFELEDNDQVFLEFDDLKIDDELSENEENKIEEVIQQSFNKPKQSKFEEDKQLKSKDQFFQNIDLLQQQYNKFLYQEINNKIF